MTAETDASDRRTDWQSRIIGKWSAAKAALPDCLILYPMGDFFELLMTDAAAAAKAMDITLTKRGLIPMCGFPKSHAETYIVKLEAAGFRVAVADAS